ncbi:hypothetical protein CWB72_14510 [Pseudoalteromonas phenolica]|uniref:hypothetical protein n=1 Tax=Pseudoalteromonas phenolica TaxID=161398 RepID=UPI00110B5E9B|nr:hypothetical protein [Pseudoalteromonas phenolica]TMN87846.1 hypothetical protein CWB72_14510 [Pseudoalteromonas phenolica]
MRKSLIFLSVCLLAACSKESKLEESYYQAEVQRDHQSQYQFAQQLVELGETSWQQRAQQHKTAIDKVTQSRAHLIQQDLITAFNLAAEAKKLDNSMAADTVLKQILSDDALQKLVKSTYTLLDKHSALISQGQKLLSEAPIEWNIIELNEFLFQLNSLIQNSEKTIELTPWQQSNQAYHLITLNTQHIEQLKLMQQQLLSTVKTATCDTLCAGLKANLKDVQKNINLFDKVAVESMMAFPFEQQLKKSREWLELNNNIRITLEEVDTILGANHKAYYQSLLRAVRGPKYDQQYWQFADEDVVRVSNAEQVEDVSFIAIELSANLKTFLENYEQLAFLR